MIAVEMRRPIDRDALNACVIGGEDVPGDGSFAVMNPFTGEEVGRAPLLGRAQIKRALDQSAATVDERSRHDRSQLLERVAGRIRSSAEPLAHLISLESGLCLKDSRYEVARAVDVFRFAAMEALRDDGDVYACDTSANGRRRRAFTTREPVQLVAAITPFNHPLNQVAHKIAPALAVGAPIVVKPSEKTPLTALWLGRILREEGAPPGAVAIITGERQVVLDAMLSHPSVDVLAFTGGVDTGKMIANRLGYRRGVLELGGNDPLLVLADADLAQAAKLAIDGATRNSGQRCTAVKRVIADVSVADELGDRMTALATELRYGDPLDELTDVGTVIDERAAVEIERRISVTVRAGATLRTGGERVGALLAPTVLDHVTADAAVVRRETFGPVAPILRAHGVDAAIELANDSGFGLSAGVVTNDLEAATRCIRRLRCGSVNVGEVPGYRTELTPFGGIKDSGLGIKEGVIEAMRAMTNQKLYTLPWR